MEINLNQKPENPVIMHGFPGFGLVGSISTEFIINHLDMEEIGNIWLDDLPAMVAIHNEKVVQPIGIFYSEKHNLIVLHIVTVAKENIEWKLADAINQMAEMLKAKEIVCIEGVKKAQDADDTDVYFHSNDKDRKNQMKEAGIKPLKEGVVVGVTSALLLKIKELIPLTCVFAETQSDFPDSKAAANVISTLDKYMGLEVDYKPLLESAQEFENKLKGILGKSAEMAKETQRKKLTYVG